MKKQMGIVLIIVGIVIAASGAVLLISGGAISSVWPP